ncbi:MAG: phospholipid carrier-dependent glycosyltransferase [Bacteroidetes bacterium]|nr:phospholipid carrier-dependent glycosyltransferase [Bacteroidota bacterium]
MYNRTAYIIAIIAAGLFLHSLGKVHLFDWDEINFAESSREMIVSGDYSRVQINYEPFWEKPPIFFWFQVLSMKVFGFTEFAARLPNAACGILTLISLYLFGRRIHGESFGRWWAFLYAATVMPHTYFKSGIIDPWFNFFTFLGIGFLALFVIGQRDERPPLRFLVFSAAFTGCAVLTKGPVAFLIVLLAYAASLAFGRRRGWSRPAHYLLWAGIFTAVTLAWFGLEVMNHGWWFIDEFIKYQIRLAKTQDAGFAGFPGYTFLVLLTGCFPASVLIFRMGDRSVEDVAAKVFRRLMISSLLVTYVIFSLVRTKVLHYSSFAYFPIGYLGATTIHGILNGTCRFPTWQRWLLTGLGMLWGIVFTGLPLLGTHLEWLRPFLAHDRFALANLEADVTWDHLLMVPGILYLAAVGFSGRWMYTGRLRPGFLLLLLANIGILQFALTTFPTRIEGYSQRAAIEYFKSLSGRRVYAETIGYKSYAPYYYFAVQPGNPRETKDEQWLLRTDSLDRPAYFVVRVDKRDKVLQEFGQRLEVLSEKNGYVLMVRRK